MHAPIFAQHTVRELKSFTRIMSVFFAVLTGAFLWRANFIMTRPTLILGVVAASWLAWGLIHLQSIRPVYHIWMWLAFCLNFVMTRIILSILFFLVFLPTSIMIRLSGRDLLGRRRKESYWCARESTRDNQHFENLFS